MVSTFILLNQFLYKASPLFLFDLCIHKVIIHKNDFQPLLQNILVKVMERINQMKDELQKDLINCMCIWCNNSVKPSHIRTIYTILKRNIITPSMQCRYESDMKLMCKSCLSKMRQI